MKLILFVLSSGLEFYLNGLKPFKRNAFVKTETELKLIASAVSLPTLVALNLINPFLFILAPIILLPKVKLGRYLLLKLFHIRYILC
jgi:hypothetical protein